MVLVEYVSRRGRRKPFVVEIDPRQAGYDLSRPVPEPQVSDYFVAGQHLLPAAVTTRGRQGAAQTWHGTPRRGKSKQFCGGVRVK